MGERVLSAIIKPKLILVLIVLILALVYSLNAQDIFKLELMMDKSAFIKGEPVEVGVSIANVSNNLIQDKYFGSLQLLIFNKNGDEVQRSGAAGDYWGPT